MILPLLLACAPKQPPAPAVDASPPAASPVHSPAVDVDSLSDDEDGAELIYFVLLDRFANGDPSNDTASPGPAPDVDDPQAWHGGDLAGVTAHLDHLDQLGVTKLWLSPVFRARTTPIGEWGAFHGYWLWDPTILEPRFGDEGDLTALTAGLEARDMGLLFDLVTNHVGYEAPLLAEHPDWFHDRGTITDWNDRTALEDGEVHGLPDLDQDQPEVRAWLTGAALQWLSAAALDGYRVDAVRHVPNTFLAELGGAVERAHPGAWWLGEDFTGDPVELAESQRTGGFTHVFDFPLHYAMTEVFCDGAPPARLASVLWQDRLYDRPEGLVTFLDNHDLPRIRSRCDDDAGALSRALLFMFTARGVPSLLYGTESGLAGAEEPHNRGDMVFGQTALGMTIAGLMELRDDHPAARGGVQRVVQLSDEAAVVARVDGTSAVVVGVNHGAAPLPLDLPAPLQGATVLAWASQHGAQPVQTGRAAGGMAWADIAAGGPHPGAVVPPGGVRVVYLRGDPRGFTATGADTAVPITVTGAPAGDGDRVVLTGTGPALGNWDPAGGVALSCADTVCTGTLDQPEGAVLEGKAVVLHADGSATWPEGGNHALLVGPDAAWELSW